MKPGINKKDLLETSEQSQAEQLAERQSLLDLFSKQADEKAKTAYERKAIQERETIELYSGRRTSVFEEREKLRKILEDLPQDYEPKFSQFFAAMGRLLNWSEEEKRAYHKPAIVAKTINEVFYDRFPKDVITYIHEKNPYVKWCTRAHKNYLFLGEDGILLLERFIDDAVIVMNESETLYEFRLKHAQRFGSGFQPVLFEEYFQNL